MLMRMNVLMMSAAVSTQIVMAVTATINPLRFFANVRVIYCVLFLSFFFFSASYFSQSFLVEELKESQDCCL